MNALSFDPQSTRIATAHGGWDGKREDYVVRIWDIAALSVIAVLEGHTAKMVNASFSSWQVRAVHSSFQGWSGEDLGRDVLERNGFIQASRRRGVSQRMLLTRREVCRYLLRRTSVVVEGGRRLVRGDVF